MKALGLPVSALALSVVALVSAGSAAADTIATTDAFLPAVHIIGASGTFRTDVSIFNPETAVNAVVKLYYTPADTDGTNLGGLTITPDLFPRETVTLSDIVLNYFQASSSYGVLEVESSVPVIVTSNTYNLVTDGTFGQFSPGQPFRNARGYDNSVRGDMYVTGIPHNANRRTNAVVMNPSNVNLEAGVQLVDASGQVLGTRIYDVPPYSMHQINDLFRGDFAAFNPPAGGPYRLNMFVNLSNGAKILGYASIIDLRTGDPYLVPAENIVIP